MPRSRSSSFDRPLLRGKKVHDYSKIPSPPSLGSHKTDISYTAGDLGTGNPANSLSSEKFDGEDEESIKYNADPLPRTRPITGTLRRYPLTFVLVVLWVIFIGMMFLGFELSVRSAANGNNISRFTKSTMKTLVTTFSQAHHIVTTFHLTRLAISGLQSKRTSPRTWRELFWSADLNWSGPLGWVLTTMEAIQRAIMVSVPFILFAITCFIALATPHLLTRAYTIETFDIWQPNGNFTPTMMSFHRLANVDDIEQLAIGEQAWSTGKSVEAMFNSSTFTKEDGEPRSEGGRELLFSGDVGNNNVTEAPSVHYSGGCKIKSDDTNLATVDLDPTTSRTSFDAECAKLGLIRGPEMTVEYENTTSAPEMSLATDIQFDGVIIRLSWCSQGPGMWNSTENRLAYDTTVASNRTGLAWFDVQRPPAPGEHPVVARGTVECTSALQFGHASLNGRNLTYSDFTAAAVDPQTDMNTAWLPYHPIIAAFTALTSEGLVARPQYEDEVMAETKFLIPIRVLLHKLGGSTITRSENTVNLPNLTSISSELWMGTTHMANALATASLEYNISYPAHTPISVTGYVRSPVFLPLTLAVIGTWLALVIGLSIWMYKATFASGLGSYAAGRLLTLRPELVEGYYWGDTGDNPHLDAPFEVVGDRHTQTLSKMIN